MNRGCTKFKSGGLHEEHVVAAWNVRNRLNICPYHLPDNVENTVSSE